MVHAGRGGVPPKGKKKPPKPNKGKEPIPDKSEPMVAVAKKEVTKPTNDGSAPSTSSPPKKDVTASE
jgi:hypothetical protein